MFPTGSCHKPSALASFCYSPESPPCRSSLIFAGKLGGVQVIRQVEDRWFDPSESFGEAIEIWTIGLGRHVWVLDHWSARPVHQVEVFSLLASPDQGCLFLLLLFGWQEVPAVGR